MVLPRHQEPVVLARLPGDAPQQAVVVLPAVAGRWGRGAAVRDPCGRATVSAVAMRQVKLGDGSPRSAPPSPVGSANRTEGAPEGSAAVRCGAAASPFGAGGCSSSCFLSQGERAVRKGTEHLQAAK